jgi:hypothetical protein
VHPPVYGRKGDGRKLSKAKEKEKKLWALMKLDDPAANLRPARAREISKRKQLCIADWWNPGLEMTRTEK